MRFLPIKYDHKLYLIVLQIVISETRQIFFLSFQLQKSLKKTLVNLYSQGFEKLQKILLPYDLGFVQKIKQKHQIVCDKPNRIPLYALTFIQK